MSHNETIEVLAPKLGYFESRGLTTDIFFVQSNKTTVYLATEDAACIFAIDLLTGNSEVLTGRNESATCAADKACLITDGQLKTATFTKILALTNNPSDSMGVFVSTRDRIREVNVRGDWVSTIISSYNYDHYDHLENDFYDIVESRGKYLVASYIRGIEIFTADWKYEGYLTQTNNGLKISFDTLSDRCMCIVHNFRITKLSSNIFRISYRRDAPYTDEIGVAFITENMTASWIALGSNSYNKPNFLKGLPLLFTVDSSRIFYSMYEMLASSTPCGLIISHINGMLNT